MVLSRSHRCCPRGPRLRGCPFNLAEKTENYGFLINLSRTYKMIGFYLLSAKYSTFIYGNN
jgi:hypothetical protein